LLGKCDRPPTLLVWPVQDCAQRSAVPAMEMSAVTLPRGNPGEFYDLTKSQSRNCSECRPQGHGGKLGGVSQDSENRLPFRLQIRQTVRQTALYRLLDLLVLQGPDRHDHFGDLHAYGLILTTYPLLPRVREVLFAGC
jgi:hypothetical protein